MEESSGIEMLIALLLPAIIVCTFNTLHVLIIYGAYLSLVAILRFYLHLVNDLQRNTQSKSREQSIH